MSILTLEHTLERFYELKDEYLSDDDGQSKTDIVVVLPEIAESSNEKGNDNVLNSDNILPNDTAGKVKVHIKSKLSDAKSSEYEEFCLVGRVISCFE
ncbi:hypothetical protein NPIL_96901 [Nephila pilipes]|uniref:Uncharacterized protein n=1 Tax=Nephila pilipes TaxID=299642 RepID=A0A8X6U291_NEPPI|nr:hypothetical protein NPIL_96901 [Nephila pilipes]